jgi:hypothetical protein
MSPHDEPGDASVTQSDAKEQSIPPPAAKASAVGNSAAPGRVRLRSRMHRTVQEIEPWGILIAVVALVLSLASIWIDYADRVEERTVRAWQLLTTRAPGNSGKIAALQYLNREDGLLCADALRGRLRWLRGDDTISCLISQRPRR